MEHFIIIIHRPATKFPNKQSEVVLTAGRLSIKNSKFSISFSRVALFL